MLDITRKQGSRIFALLLLSLFSIPIFVSAEEAQLSPKEPRGVGGYALENCTLAGEPVSFGGVFATSSPMRAATLACHIGPMSSTATTTFTLKLTVTDKTVGDEVYSYEKKFEVSARPKERLSYPVTFLLRDVFVTGSYRVALTIQDEATGKAGEEHTFHVSVGDDSATFIAVSASALSHSAGDLVTINATGKFTNDTPHILLGVVRSGTERCSAEKTEKFTGDMVTLKIFLDKDCPDAQVDLEMIGTVDGVRVARARADVILTPGGVGARALIPSVLLLLAVSTFLFVERKKLSISVAGVGSK